MFRKAAITAAVVLGLLTPQMAYAQRDRREEGPPANLGRAAAAQQQQARQGVQEGRLVPMAQVIAALNRQQLTVQGEHVAMVPNRDTLIITGSEDDEGLGIMASLAEEAFRKPRPMTALAFCLEGDEWAPWQPSRRSPAFKQFQALRAQSIGQEYTDQKDLLEKSLRRREEELFVASFMAMRNNNTGEIISFCSWADGVPSLLPRTDRIAFLREGSEPILVDWEKAEQIVGHLISPQDMYPERVRVDEFPSEQEYARLKTVAEA